MSLEELFASRDFGFRREFFEYLAKQLLALQRPVLIIETGSMRPNDLPSDDGQSTIVWDWLVQQLGGACFTIDNNPQHSQYTKGFVSERTAIVTSESIRFLSAITQTMQPIDLLYLDSMDWQGTEQERLESSLHHIGELAAIWPYVAPNGIVAVDDCLGTFHGKHALIECFFGMLKIEPLITGSIYAWRKPCPLK